MIPRRCAHGNASPCPWPGCPSGVVGTRFVLCGLDGAHHFERGFVERGGALVVGWEDLGAKQARELAARADEGRTECGR